MLTSYGAKLTGEDVHQEYPRPQLVRDSYLNLNGIWEYAFTASREEPAQYEGEILVPFPPESELSRVGKPFPAGSCLWYRRAFALPEGFRRARVLLHFGAVDQTACVWCNGEAVIRHAGGYTGFSADITELLAEGTNTLTVRVEDELASGICAYGAQKRHAAWSGIWQTVWCESVPDEYIESVRILPLPEEEAVELTVFPGGTESAGQTCSAVVLGKRYEFPAQEPCRIPARGLELWTPETPRLYGMDIFLGEDKVRSYFGLRSLTLGRDEKGTRRFLLNGKPFFLSGVLYQGYWPDGVCTPPADEALARDVAAAKAMGFNAIRLRDKIGSPRFYWHCDRLGLLVIQGLPAGGGPGLPLRGPVKDFNYAFYGRKDAEGRNQFKREMREAVQQLRNAPSLAIWELFDEARGQFETESLSVYLDELDGTRLIDRASGGADQGFGDFRSLHAMGTKLRYRPDAKNRPTLLSACGGFGNRAEGHCWSGKSTASVLYDSPQLLAYAVQDLYEGQIGPAAEEGLLGCVYCQLTDVEDEVTGFLTYDRGLCKIAPQQLRKLIQLRL